MDTIIAKQTPENNPSEINIKSTERREEDHATIVVFDCGDFCDLHAVIYDDGTCFTPSDWTVSADYDAVEWYDHENQRHGVVLNGLPRSME